MKIALSLFGYFNNRADDNAGMKGYSYIKENILKHPNVDVFIHSWDIENSGRIIDLYNPKASIFEVQKDFNTIAIEHGIDEKEINNGFDRRNSMYYQCTVQNLLSFYYTRKESINLIKNEIYDVVITARFDLGHRSGFHRGYNVSLINFNPKLDMDKLYVPLYTQNNCGLPDQHFYSSLENIKLLSGAYDCALEQFKIGSDYHHQITTGWFDSNSENEFSNEILKPIEKRSINLIKYPTWQLLNSHIFYKYYVKCIGLYEKIVFL